MLAKLENMRAEFNSKLDAVTKRKKKEIGVYAARDDDLEVPEPKLEITDTPKIKSLKRLKDFKVLYNLKYREQQSSLTFLTNFVNSCNNYEPPFTTYEYTTLLLSSFEGNVKDSILNLFGGEGMSTVSPKALHQIILSATGEHIPLEARKSNFYNYFPKNGRISVGQIVADIALLGSQGKISPIESTPGF